MEVCHDNRTGSTRWVHYQLKPNNANHQRNVDRIFFIQGDFYHGLYVEDLYRRYKQRETIGRILGSKELANKIVLDDSELYLARGHMAAKADVCIL